MLRGDDLKWTTERVVGFLLAKGLGPGPFEVKPLAGGYWNDVLRIRGPDLTLVFKGYVEVMSGTLFPNLPDDEAAALERLAGLAVAPEPVGYWPDERVLVYRYVEGEVWDGDVAAVARLLRRKEAADPSGFRSVAMTPAELIAEGDRLYARCAEDALVASYRARCPRPIAIAEPDRLSLIHADIGATNMIGSGDGLRLIDWQCPAAGDLAEDVYTFLSPAFQILNLREPLDDGERRAFLAALDMPAIAERHRRLEPYFAYRMGAYCCLRYQTAADAPVKSRYARAATAELARIPAP